MQLFALMTVVALLLVAPSVANAQVDVTGIRVTITSNGAPGGLPWTAVYCDTTTTCTGGLQIWNLGGGVHLDAGQTLVLTQTGLVTGVGGNFDTSEPVNPSGTPAEECNTGAGNPCTVVIELKTGAGALTTVYTNSVDSNLVAQNQDTGGDFDEVQPFDELAATGVGYEMRLGYADNAHGCTVDCFPTPFSGTADFFIGNPVFLDTTYSTCGATSSCYDGGAILITGQPVEQSGTGRFTGGGKQIDAGGVSITKGLTIHCDLLLSNNFEINWKSGGKQHQFHMEDHFVTLECSDDPNIKQEPPKAPLDTLVGKGYGRYDGVDGYTVEFTLVDAGEPGRNDTAKIKIFETLNPGNVVLDLPTTPFIGGNLQAHYDQPHK
ncbi:MAG TPA: hypothetical protein VFY40_02625 [Blastocatellia bacterium]|nr:hypothetical protein [Blastocatellia bacterium]